MRLSSVRFPRQVPSSTAEILLHIAALNSFAVAEPIFDQLSKNSAYLRYYNYSPVAIMVAASVFLLLVPLAATLMIYLISRSRWTRLAGPVLCLIIFSLTSMSALIGARWLATTLSLMIHGIPEHLVSLLAIGCAGVMTWWYFRSPGVRHALLLCSIGTILFPAGFLASDTVQQEVFGRNTEPRSDVVTIRKPAPVIMIVFDGLCGMSLLNEDHEIDRVRYPAFARLADRSHVFRNATTVHPRTDHALPAILSGSQPEEAQRPLEEDYPLNLFRIMEQSRQYELTIFEPFTQMAPQRLHRIVNDASVPMQSLNLVRVLSYVYAKLCVPRSLEFLDVPVPREWFRMERPPSADGHGRSGKIVYSWDTDRDTQFQHFLSCLTAEERPSFRFLHLVIPHDPWTMLPSGNSYSHIEQYDTPIVGNLDDYWTSDEWIVTQGWQRYLYQVQYADRCLGQMLDHLEATGQFDEALIVVTADHGMGFVPGKRRREPDAATLPDIFSIPLFIKQPQQKSGLMSDRNVESIDILPTIAEILGTPASPDWDGESVFGSDPEKSRKMLCGNYASMLDPAFPQRFQYVDRMLRLFGSGARDDRLNSVQLIPELIGTRVSEHRQEGNAPFRCIMLNGDDRYDPANPGYVPCYLRGRLYGPGTTVVQLAIAIDGVVVGTTRSLWDIDNRMLWSAMISEAVVREAKNSPELYQVVAESDGWVFRRVQLEPKSD